MCFLIYLRHCCVIGTQVYSMCNIWDTGSVTLMNVISTTNALKNSSRHYYFLLVSSGNRTPGRFYSDILDTAVCIHQLVLKALGARVVVGG